MRPKAPWRPPLQPPATAMRSMKSHVVAASDLPAAERPLEELLAEVREALKIAIACCERRLFGLRKQLRDPAEEMLWRRRGSGLLTLPKGKWRRGLTQVEVQDYENLDPDGLPLSLTVKLDPEKDFQENAKLCFKQASKSERANLKCQPLIEAQEAEMQGWQQELERLSSDSNEVRRLHTELSEKEYIRLPEPEKTPEEVAVNLARLKYGKDIDRFVSPSGFEILAGRSASANERVSFEITMKDAYWFHTANQIPGSHVTIMANSKLVTAEDLEFAAGIAAWHSKARDKFYAPVMYCLGHQLRKPARRRTGQVSVSGNFRVLDVTPALPGADSGSEEEWSEED